MIVNTLEKRVEVQEFFVEVVFLDNVCTNVHLTAWVIIMLSACYC